MEDRARVRALLGREPRGSYEVVVRSPDGDPVVVRNAPLLDDGTPMPTRYWLIGREQVRAVSRLEAAGGIGAAEAEIDPAAVADAHSRYAVERDAALPTDYAGPRPTGGVGGTRVGVKCLHAHYAWHLAGGDDPVGRWVAAHLDPDRDVQMSVDVGDDDCTVHDAESWTTTIPLGPMALVAELSGSDPPAPEQLTNALGAFTDHLDDVLRERPGLLSVSDVLFSGPEVAHLARVEVGGDAPATAFTLARDAAEELFRTLATESSADRLHNPGLDPHRVETIVATCCIVLAVMRRLRLGAVTLQTEGHRR